MEGGVTHGSRPRTDNRDRGDLLANVFASDHKHCYDTRHDEPDIARTPQTRGRWRLSWWQLFRARGNASVVRPGPAGSTSNPGSNSEVSERDYQTDKNRVYPTSVNGINEIIQHAISFTVFGTHVIFETPHCCDRQYRGPT